jgi:hypothetical protein
MNDFLLYKHKISLQLMKTRKIIRIKNENVTIKQAFDELKWFVNPFKLI